MNRRDLLKMISATTGTAMIGANAALLSGCSNNGDAPTAEKALRYDLSERDVELLNEVAETILPRTDTPGAKDADVGPFMARFVEACYSPEEQAVFYTAIPQIEQRSEAEYDNSFLELSTEQRESVLRTFDREARQRGSDHFYTMVKQLTLFGFFTSEVGATQVLRHIPIPGRYEGCAPYEEGEPAWAFT